MEPHDEQNNEKNVDDSLLSNCFLHKSEIKYYCIDLECTAQSRLACAECIVEQPHGSHHKLKYSDLQIKLLEIQKKINKHMQENEDQINVYKQTQEKIKSSISTIRQKVNDQLQKIEENILAQLEQIFKSVQQDQVKAKALQDQICPQNIPKLKEKDPINLILNILNNQANDQILSKYFQKKIPENAKNMLQSSLQSLDGNTNEFIQKNQDLFQNKMDSAKIFEQTDIKLNLHQFLGKKDYELTEHQGFIPCLIKLDNELFVTGSKDGVIKVWNVFYNKSLKTITNDSAINSMIKFNGKQNKIITGDNKHVKIWDTNDGQCTLIMRGHKHAILALIQLDDNKIVSGGKDHDLIFWDVDKGYSYYIIDEAHRGDIRTLMKLNDTTMISGGEDNNMKLWNITDNLLIKTIKCDGNVKASLKINEEYFAIGTGGLIGIWKISDMKKKIELKGHQCDITNLINLHDNAIASASIDNTIRIWMWKDGTCLKTLNSHTKSVYGLEILDTKKLVSSSNDSKIIIWK